MPSFITHNIFAKEVKASIKPEAKEILNNYNEIYEMASQSFDLLKYSLKKHKECINLCKKCHRINVNKYFEELVNIAKIENNDELNAFIFGSILHQILDATMHPYIVYKTGIYNHKPETLKYYGLHSLMETQYDLFTYQRYYQKVLINHNIKKEFIPFLKVKKETIASINQVFLNMYNFNGGIYLFYGYKCARRYMNLIRRPNILNGIYYAIPKNKSLRNYLYSKNNISYNFLNVNHRKWVYPSDNTIVKTDSMIDLYNNALTDGINAINACYDAIYNKKSIKPLLKIIGNKGYIRGTDCNTLNPIKYFEF